MSTACTHNDRLTDSDLGPDDAYGHLPQAARGVCHDGVITGISVLSFSGRARVIEEARILNSNIFEENLALKCLNIIFGRDCKAVSPSMRCLDGLLSSMS